MAIDNDAALERALSEGDEWQSWRALRLSGDDPGPLPALPDQDAEGGFIGPGGRVSPGATGERICHLTTLGQGESGAAVVAGDWLEQSRTPAGAWLDPPDEVPGELDATAGARVWATASATCALLAVGRDPGTRAIELLRGEADQQGHFTGGAYPTFAAAGAYWLARGPQNEMTEWALRWARETDDEAWGPWERATALTFWGAAGIPLENRSVDMFLEKLRAEAPPSGWDEDLGLTLRTLELMAHFGA